MARISKFFCGPTAVAALAAVLLTAGSGPETAAAARGWQATPKGVLKQNSKAEKQAKELLGNTKYVPLVKTYTPEPTSTKGYTGYETITVKAPKGTAPVVGYFSLTGAERCSVVVTSAQVVLKKNAYVVELKFPGEQGNPGKLKVTLVSS